LSHATTTLSRAIETECQKEADERSNERRGQVRQELSPERGHAFKHNAGFGNQGKLLGGPLSVWDKAELMGAWESARHVAGPLNTTREPRSGAGGSEMPKANDTQRRFRRRATRRGRLINTCALFSLNVEVSGRDTAPDVVVYGASIDTRFGLLSVSETISAECHEYLRRPSAQPAFLGLPRSY
jgi:hypothetical protein